MHKSRTRVAGRPRAASSCRIAHTASPSNASMTVFMKTGVSEMRVAARNTSWAAGG